ncbi:hypothetical protein BQ8420_00815 [Nocardiopsis sp. JB363]|nr:hypothetical protein BQ8420_00815 [Nocardiopsis sp. JB363]
MGTLRGRERLSRLLRRLPLRLLRGIRVGHRTSGEGGAEEGITGHAASVEYDAVQGRKVPRITPGTAPTPPERRR